MHFKHPELLYALLLLLIPVLVHLFQLRRFRTEKFTNVKFLRKASLQTRKSSRIKKWLILCTRIFLFASLIIAFAQPFIPSSEESLMEQEMLIYIDNSYSMQARGADGILLRRAVQEVLEKLPQESEISLFTNDREFMNRRVASLRKDLLQLDFSTQQLPWQSIRLKAENAFSRFPTTKHFIAISDFQLLEEREILPTEAFHTHLVQLRPEQRKNISIDTAYISDKNIEGSTLNVELKSTGATQTEIPISLYDGSRLLAKKTVTLDKDSAGNSNFDLPPSPIQKGIIRIEEAGLSFDNELFFSINETEPIAVVVIGNAEISFLERIYRSPDFNLQLFPENQIDFSSLSEANLIILNEPKQLSQSLIRSLLTLVKENSSLAIIPSEEADLPAYNSLLQQLRLPTFTEHSTAGKLITEISFGSPLFRNVFQEEVENFQYPRVNSHYRLVGNIPSALAFENQEAFLIQRDHLFLFTAPLNTGNSNFQNSPLIVPTFYEMGNLSMLPSELYYSLDENHKINVKADMGTDEILELSNSESSFIPLQQNFPNKVEIDLTNAPVEMGHYEILRDSVVLRTLSFNIDRRESRLEYLSLKPSEGLTIRQSVSDTFESIESRSNIDSFWKCFVIFALIFLFIEMLLLKFYK